MAGLEQHRGWRIGKVRYETHEKEKDVLLVLLHTRLLS